MSTLSWLWTLFDDSPWLRAVAAFVVVIGTLALLFSIALVMHHSMSSYRRARRTEAIRRATPFLAPHIGSGDLKAAVEESRRRYGAWATSIVLREGRREMAGDRAAEITQALVDMGEVERLRALAHSRFDYKRVQALRELGQVGGDEARSILLEATRDKKPEVRRAAREGLLADGRPASIKAAIHSYLEDAPSGMAWKRSFYARLSKVAADQLRELLDSQSLALTEEKLALEALGDARVAAALPLARARLRSEDPEIRATAARVVGKLEDKASVPILSELLGDPEWYVRAAATKAFEHVRADDGVLETLSRSLSDSAWWVRANAANALTRQGEPGTELLLNAVEGADAYARDAALAALSYTVLDPASRRRLERVVAKIQDESQAATVRRMLEAVPAEARA